MNDVSAYGAGMLLTAAARRTAACQAGFKFQGLRGTMAWKAGALQSFCFRLLDNIVMDKGISSIYLY
jgi:hypothetical protein